MNISKLMIKLDIPLPWVTPVGLNLTQHYLNSKINKISISLARGSKKQKKTLVLIKFEKEINNRKQIQAINIRHSLEAIHLIKLINYVSSSCSSRRTSGNKVNYLKYLIPVHYFLGHYQIN